MLYVIIEALFSQQIFTKDIFNAWPFLSISDAKIVPSLHFTMLPGTHSPVQAWSYVQLVSV
jgi:hypothetical protein